MARGWALKVPLWENPVPGLLLSRRSIRSARPPKAPTGNPPPTIFPKQVRSGSMPNTAWSPPGRRAEGDDLVEDEQDAVFPRDPSNRLGELGPDGQDSALGIEDDAGQIFPVLHDEPFHRLFVVVGQDQDLIGHAGGTSSRPRDGIGCVGRARLGQGRRDTDLHRIMTAVIAPFEFGDLRLSGRTRGPAESRAGWLRSPN